MKSGGAWPGVSMDGVPPELVARIMAARQHPDASRSAHALAPPSALEVARAGVLQLQASNPGAARDPAAALDLLAADALITAACRVALDEPSPTTVLKGILDAVNGAAGKESS